MYTLFPFFIPSILTLIAFITFLVHRRVWMNIFLFRLTEILALTVLPVLFLMVMDKDSSMTCCGDSSLFHPDHRTTVYTFIILSLLAYSYCTIRQRMGPPLLELIASSLITIGFIINALVFVHAEPNLITVAGNGSVLMLYLMVMIRNFDLYRAGWMEMDMGKMHPLIAWLTHSFGQLPAVQQIIYLLIGAPVFAVVTALLVVFGQRPDSAIRAFTDTFHHGLSQWDFMCENIQCGGHFLCSVAANGHDRIVKPTRLGIRHGKYIRCNRQLLVSNAFENVLEQYLPRTHRFVRRNYNRVGNLIHRHYHFFGHKWVSDTVYILMKPAEWLFLAVIYLVDRKPENRIARQYLPPEMVQQVG